MINIVYGKKEEESRTVFSKQKFFLQYDDDGFFYLQPETFKFIPNIPMPHLNCLSVFREPSLLLHELDFSPIYILTDILSFLRRSFRPDEQNYRQIF